MDLLKHEPLPSQIEAVLAAEYSAVDFFQLVSTLLKHTVPGTYTQLPPSTQNAVARVFRTPVGLGNLLARIDMLARLKADIREDVAVVVSSHTHLLARVLAPDLVQTMVAGATPAEVRETDKLLFKGRCFAVLRAAEMRFAHVYVPPQLVSMDAYAHYLGRQLLAVSEPTFTLSLLSLSDVLHLHYFDVMFRKDAVHRVDLAPMKRFERKAVLVKFLDYCARRYLSLPAENDLVAALYVLGSRLFSGPSLWDDILLDKVISHYSYALNMLAALLAAPDLALKALAVWGNSSQMNIEPVVRQEFRTHLLVCLCAQLPPDALQAMLKEPAFVTAISNRLLSLSDRVKTLGVFFADRVCVMAGAAKIFDMDAQVDIPTTVLSRSEILLGADDAWEILESPQVVVEDDSLTVGELQDKLQPISIKESYEDAAMSDEEDDPTLATSEKPVPKPIYVRDLLAYLSVDTSAPQAYEKRQIALQTAPSLLRQKLSFGTEVSFYAEDLFTQLAALTNHYEDKDFETLKLNAMIAVVVGCPTVTGHLCRLLLTADYSLQQRMCLLSALSLGARELRGYKDDVVVSSFKPAEFASKMLPEKLHRQYLAAAGEVDYAYGKIENSIQNQLMSEAAEEARDELAGGKILRMSSSLKKKPQLQEVQLSKEKLAGFNKTVGARFFFPLLAVWYESGGINVGHYTPVLVAHFVRTLSIILHCAYPAATGLLDMAGEYMNLLCGVLEKVTPDQLQVVESVATGVMLVCDIMDEVYLASHYGNSLMLVENTVGGWWESLIDERVKSLCAGLLLRVAKLRTSMERVLMDQMSPFQ